MVNINISSKPTPLMLELLNKLDKLTFEYEEYKMQSEIELAHCKAQEIMEVKNEIYQWLPEGQ